MTPDFLARFPGLVAARLHPLLPGLRTCEGMEGRFDLDALATVTARAPAVLVGWLGASMPRPLAGPHWHYHLRLAAFVITKDTVDLKRDAASATICQVLLQNIPGATWGIPAAGPAMEVVATSLSGSSAKAKGVSIWAVTWTQPVVLEDLPAQILVPISLYVSQAPAIGAAHEDAYDQIGSADE